MLLLWPLVQVPFMPKLASWLASADVRDLLLPPLPLEAGEELAGAELAGAALPEAAGVVLAGTAASLLTTGLATGAADEEPHCWLEE